MARKSLIAKSGKEVLGKFDFGQYPSCALVVATFGDTKGQVLYDGQVVWSNELDGDASESYDNFYSVVLKRIQRNND